MLRACSASGDMLAFTVDKAQGPFSCPVCAQPVILKRGPIIVPHFAHQSRADCNYREGESTTHLQAKMEIATALLRTPGVTNVHLEHVLDTVRPDISFSLRGTSVAIEVQISTLSLDDISRRTISYARKNMAVLWTSPYSNDLEDDRYAPKSWERYLHALYFGRIYYWVEHLALQPVTFEEYLLQPNYYEPQRRSKRYVTPIFLDSVLITDLTATWRNPWRNAWYDLPRARLWRERSLQKG
jgi:competence protein CoiA